MKDGDIPLCLRDPTANEWHIVGLLTLCKTCNFEIKWFHMKMFNAWTQQFSCFYSEFYTVMFFPLLLWSKCETRRKWLTVKPTICRPVSSRSSGVWRNEISSVTRELGLLNVTYSLRIVLKEQRSFQEPFEWSISFLFGWANSKKQVYPVRWAQEDQMCLIKVEKPNFPYPWKCMVG